jgi:hypothetical protein
MTGYGALNNINAGMVVFDKLLGVQLFTSKASKEKEPQKSRVLDAAVSTLRPGRI